MDSAHSSSGTGGVLRGLAKTTLVAAPALVRNLDGYLGHSLALALRLNRLRNGSYEPITHSGQECPLPIDLADKSVRTFWPWVGTIFPSDRDPGSRSNSLVGRVVHGSSSRNSAA